MFAGRRILLFTFLRSAVLRAQPDLAKAGLSEFQKVRRQGGDRLWGVSLCGRLLLVDPQTRQVVTAVADPDGKLVEKNGLYEGKLPADMLIANTSIRWGGEEWAMVQVPLPTEEFQRIRLLAHESFHRVQPGLGLRVSGAVSGHLDSESGRLWLRLELRALAQALRSEGDAARSAAPSVMSSMGEQRRANRRSRFKKALPNIPAQ